MRRLTQQLEQTRTKLRKSRSNSSMADAPSFADPERGFRLLVERAWGTRIPVTEQPGCPLGATRWGQTSYGTSTRCTVSVLTGSPTW